MAVLDTASKNREELLFDRYRAGRDVVERFHQRPTLRLRDSARAARPHTAAILVEKLLTDGIEVHQATQKFVANGSTFQEGDWVVLMDQPFAALVKELFDVQHYPDLRAPATDRGCRCGRRRGGRWRRKRWTWRRAGGCSGYASSGCRSSGRWWWRRRARWTRRRSGRRRWSGRRRSRRRRSGAGATALRRDGMDVAYPNGRGNDRRGGTGLRRNTQHAARDREG